MAKRLSEYLSINSKELTDLGTFDPILSVDSKFFIDPKSLSETTAEEFKGSREKLTSRYDSILHLLAESKTEGDAFWKAAYKHFPKGEVQEICVGYGFDNTGGRGIGPELVTETLGTVKEFIESGVDDPMLLELVGMFQKGVGSDIVSDMIARTLVDDIIKYTSRITKELIKKTSVEPLEYVHEGSKELAFYNPYNKKKLFLLPLDILQPLPVAYDWESVDQVSAMNEKVRNDFAKMIGAYDWKRAKTKANKDILKKAMLSHPVAVRDLLKQYEKKPAKDAYDFTKDPRGEYTWQDRAKDLTDNNPLSLPKASTPEEVEAVVLRIIKKFTEIVENNGGWSAFYTRGENSEVMHESYPQKLFYGVADAYCDANNLDISPETNSGRGPVDFKFSNGKKAKVLVEIKLTSSSQLKHGFNVQVGEYEKAEKPYSSHYLVLKVTHEKDYSAALTTAMADALGQKKKMPQVHYVNAQKQKSASRA